jgi:hypothetical protein
VQQHRGTERLDALGALLQLVAAPAGHAEIEARSKQPALASCQRARQLVGVLGGGGEGWVGEAAAIRVEAATGLKACALATEPVGRERGRNGTDVQR